MSDKQSTLFNESKSIYDLQDVIQQYQANPELLRLILTSKVEEDRRRTEEARLKAKELDLYYNTPNSPPRTPRLSITESIYSENIKSHKILPFIHKIHNKSMPYNIPTRTHHSISSISSKEDDEILDHQQRRHSAAAAMLAMGNNLIEPIPSENNMTNQENSEMISVAYPSPLAEEEEDKPKRKREMQAITKIVETREFPYIDNYFWKNNGNTIQKKTGCKSVYYKCSNSNKGCGVNKTVTAKPNGEYLIKYRGSHLSECGKVERIRDL